MTVAEVQQALLEAGHSIDRTELANSVMGPSSVHAVRVFQAGHRGPGGQRLDVDGEVGPLTAWALRLSSLGRVSPLGAGWRCDLSQARSEVRPVLEAAIGELGTREYPAGSNRGPRVDVYTGGEAIPWCAAYASWCWAHAPSGSPFGRLMSALKIRDWGRENGRLVDAPQPGDIWVIMRGAVHGHVGLVAHALDPERIATIEGNSSGAVRGLVRMRSDLTAIVRPA